MRYPTPALWRVKVLRVHDGDTVTVLTDRGLDDMSTLAIRLKDVHAPELTQPGGVECRDFAAAWVAHNADGTEWPFLLETFRTPRSDVEVMTFDRYVGAITSADGRNLNVDVQAFVTASGYGAGS